MCKVFDEITISYEVHVSTVLKIGLIGRLILFGGCPLKITLIPLIMRLGD